MKHNHQAGNRSTYYGRSRNRGNAVIVALIGLVGVVLAALINRGVIFKEGDDAAAKRQPTPAKVEQPAPAPSSSAWPSISYQPRAIILKNAQPQAAPEADQAQGVKERVVACQNKCANNHSSCANPAKRKLDKCIGKCEGLCNVCKSDACFNSCESCQEICSSSSNDAIDSCKEDFNACNFDCR